MPAGFVPTELQVRRPQRLERCAISPNAFRQRLVVDDPGLLSCSFRTQGSSQLNLRRELAVAVAEYANRIFLFSTPDYFLRHEMLADAAAVEGEYVSRLDFDYTLARVATARFEKKWQTEFFL